MIASVSKVTFALLITVVISSPRLLAADYPYEPQPAAAAEPDPGQELGYGVGSVLASILYSPLKVTYAGLGLLTGGIGWVLSAGNPYVANNIIYPAVTGNYVITPRHLKGEEPVIFIGQQPPPNYAQPEINPQPEPYRP